MLDYTTFPTIEEIEKMKANEILFKILEAYQIGKHDGINEVFKVLKKE